jgi:hypothetical protein
MNDFDFLVGSWDLANRRLRKALAGCTEWEEFPSTLWCKSLLGGVGNIDETTFPTKGYFGGTLRLFNREREEWSLYPLNSRNPIIDLPQVGRFVDGVGDFLGDDTYEGQSIRVRFRWSNITANSAHWEQAFSIDNETTWETNWMNDLTRSV